MRKIGLVIVTSLLAVTLAACGNTKVIIQLLVRITRRLLKKHQMEMVLVRLLLVAQHLILRI